ncbi:hypothetical protein [Candidatus Phytoplasma solani]|uniref:hypothetical protein n=1 Tax=Candidatus Phytoplasma solani TaxID=69896 RepID=UPI0032DA2905
MEQCKLLTEQNKINTINQELGSLSQQQISLQQEISILTQTYEEWQKNCEIKANETLSTYDNKDGIYYSPVPFQIKIKPILHAEDMGDWYCNRGFQDKNITTIDSYKTEINGNDVYYIRYSERSSYIGTLTHDDKSWFMDVENYKNGPNKQEYWELKFSHDVSTTPPPNKLDNYKSILEEKTNNLNEITQQLNNKQEELNKQKNEITDLITNQKSDDTLQQELNNKETHIKNLKDEMQQLEIKEQGFRSEIDTLKLENKNLKEKYTNVLNKIQKELDTYKTENEQLEKEMQEIQDELVKNGNANEALVNQLNTKQSQIKELKGKINTLEANETQLQEIIKQKDEEIAKLQQTIQEQAEQIMKLTAEIESNMETFKQQAMRIKQLEGAIAGLEGASGSLGLDNKELQHEIEKLKEQLKTEQNAHEAMKRQLDKQIREVEVDRLKLTTDAKELRNKTTNWQKGVERTGALITTGLSVKSGAVYGAAAGSALLPGVGTFIGGLAGAALGGATAVATKWDTFKDWFGW